MPLAEEFELLFPKVNPPWEVSSVALTSNLPPPFPSHLIPFELSLPPFRPVAPTSPLASIVFGPFASYVWSFGPL